MSHRHLKPLYWGIFSAGGMVAALLLVPLLMVLCVLLPFGVLAEPASVQQAAQKILSNKIIYTLLAGLLFVMLWHALHRMYYVLHDMHWPVGNRTRVALYMLAVLCLVISLWFGWR